VHRPHRELEFFTATSEGVIADKPAGPLVLGWDRLFVPTDDNEDEETLAEISARGAVATFRAELYRRVFA
jgi:inosine/xanthosine triphosphate pyrophosphatase family protein